MKALISLILFIGLAAPGLAQEAAQADETAAPAAAAQDTMFSAPLWSSSHIDFGVQGVDVDTPSSRFIEYRSVPTGPNLPGLSFAGQTDKLRYDLSAKHVLQSDAQYFVSLEPEGVRFTVEYNKIPHVFGTDGRTLLSRVADGTFVINDTVQQYNQGVLESVPRSQINYDFLNNLLAPSLSDAAFVSDLSLQRERGRAEAQLTKTDPLDVKFTYFHERRRGTRAVGTSFGFGNVVESPEPIDYRTQDVGLQAQYKQAWGLLQGSFDYNWFTNSIPFHTFDNPFRATDSTDGSAYTAPGSGSIAGPVFGRAALWPDNKAVNGNLGVTFKLAHRTRLSASLGIGQWTQDQQDFIPYTSNTAIETPALPAQRLDGKIDTTTFSTYLTTQPVDGLTLAARYRRYEQDNKTGRLTFPGYVRFDGVFEDLPRISVPYGNTNSQAQFTATYAFDKVSVEGGWKLEKKERTFRETEDTNENTFLGRVDVRPNDWVTLRGNVEFGSRDYNGLEIELSEEASFLESGDPGNLLAVPASGGSSAIRAAYASLGCGSAICNLRYDQAAKDISRYGGSLMLTPGGKASLNISYLKGKDDYTQSLYGLINDERETFGLDGDYTFSARANVFAYYTRENIKNFQRGRQSGASVSSNPLDDWTSSVEDKADTFGGGANFNLVKDKLDLKLNGSYQKVDGNNDLFSPPGGSPDIAVPIAQYDDTKLYTLGSELSYSATKSVRLALGGWYEKYEIMDAQTSNLLNYVPASLFLNPIDGDYEAKVVYVRASYIW